MKYRIGRKQKRAILREDGTEVVILPKGMEDEATRLCNLLNNDQQLQKKAKQFKQFIDNALDVAKSDLENNKVNDYEVIKYIRGYMTGIIDMKKKYDELHS